MNVVDCATNGVTTGAGRGREDNNYDRNNFGRSQYDHHPQPQQHQQRFRDSAHRPTPHSSEGGSSVTSTMRSSATTTTIPDDHRRNQLKVEGTGGGGGKGHYGSSSTVELYFAWFSAITFIGQIVVDISLTTFYFQAGHSQWAIITLAIVLVPLVLCQIYSVVLMRSDQHYHHSKEDTHRESLWAPILWHICLMGIPYRYFHLFKRVDDIPSHEMRYKLQEIQAIQTINAILQYCPQCLFQVFIIMYRNFACLFTGISAGLACFSFLWHLFLQCYTLAQRNHDDYKISAGPNFTSNLRVNNLENNSSSLATILTSTSSTSIAMDDHRGGAAGAVCVSYNPSAEEAAVLKKNLQILEKNSLMDNRNLVPKEGKSVEKVKIFQFNKRRPICSGDDEDRIDQLDESEVFQNKSTIYYEMTEEDDDLQKPQGAFESVAAGELNSMPRLKRKGICSSQEMLHLVDLMNENISADQIDKLEQSLLDLNGMDVSSDHQQQLQNISSNAPSGTMNTDEKSVAGSRGSEGDGESTNNFKGFPLDESTQSSILENIDAAIYENQIIFQERIRKNQLTIQNLKLQDQLLSQFMDLGANGGISANTSDLQRILMSLDDQQRRASLSLSSLSLGRDDPSSGNEHNTSMGYLSTRDYENMCFVNITRNVNKLKHWRNYVQNIQSNQHDTSTAMNSNFLGNSTSAIEQAEAKVDDLYMVMQPIVQNKNILVETINQINDTSPLKDSRPSNGDHNLDCEDLPDDHLGHKLLRKEQGGKAVPGLYFYNLNNLPLDSILESNCEDT